ncbi:MAG: hypothetical protein PHX05_04495 [Acidobacteriota bacterium]|nr:hypothetical protein [Acidobacteriota bacterium]
MVIWALEKKMASDMDEKARNEVAALKERLRADKDAATSLEDLAGAPIQHHFPIDLWSLSDSELDNEMGKRLSFLNEDIDCRPTVEIASHRRFIGPFIVFCKKLLLWAMRPYTNSLFVRQNRFNEQLVAFHLASFIRFRRLEERAKRLEKLAGETLEGGEDEVPAVRHD